MSSYHHFLFNFPVFLTPFFLRPGPRPLDTCRAGRALGRRPSGAQGPNPMAPGSLSGTKLLRGDFVWWQDGGKGTEGQDPTRTPLLGERETQTLARIGAHASQKAAGPPTSLRWAPHASARTHLATRGRMVTS